jgi:hypothetical protein
MSIMDFTLDNEIEYKDLNLCFRSGVLVSIEMYTEVLERWVPVKDMRPFFKDEGIRKILDQEEVCHAEKLRAARYIKEQLTFNDWKRDAK